MDKNNDIKVNKISKWKEAPDSIKDLYSIINAIFIGLSLTIDPKKADDKNYTLNKLLFRVLDDYNELEAKYQEACGMISQYEEENRNLKSELDIKTDECDALISRVFKQDEEYTWLKEENKELRETRELLNEVNSKQCAEVDDLEADIKDLEVQVRVNKGIASIYESEIKQIIDLAKSYGLIIYDDRKDAISDDVKNIGMCGHYYVLGGRAKEESKDIQKLEKKWKNAENAIKELMQVLNYEHIDVSHSKSSWTIHNRALSEKTKHFDAQLHNLREIIRDLKADSVNLHKQAAMRAEACDRHIDLLDKLRWALGDKGISCEWNEAELEWRLYGKNELISELKQHYEYELRIRCEEIDGKNKLIDELKQKIEALESENKCLDFKYHTYKAYKTSRYIGHIRSLKDKISALEKENKDLKDTLEKDGYDELEEKLKSAEDSIRTLQEFLKKCGVPVKYRNDDTWYWDFENSAWDDTLMKDCKLIDKCRKLETENKELRDKIGVRKTIEFMKESVTTTRVAQLQRDIENLKSENNNLTTDNKRLSNAVEAWFYMFNDMRHKRDFLKKEYEKLKETNKSLRRTVRFLDEGGSYELHSCPVSCECENFKPKVHHSYDPLDEGGSYELHSCPVSCECENFKPKVHHSYDPLDDLPDVEHS